MIAIVSTLLALPLTLLSMPVTGRHFAAAPRTCAVLQAAYTSAIGARAPAYPIDVRMEHDPHGISGVVAESWTDLGLTPNESDDLVARQALYRDPSFRPLCQWKGSPGPAADDEGHGTYITFSSPIFSTDGKIALVEVSTREKGTFGYGVKCVVRSKRHRWSARCIQSWIT